MEIDAIQKLKGIGLNQLEAEVYHLLLSEAPMTAYKVAKLLKKPTANIYKAVEVLCAKGAMVVEEGKNKLCRAVPPEEFIAVQENEFTRKAAEAAQALRDIRRKSDEETTCSLDSVGLALEKAVRMIESAKVVIVADAFPLALAPLKKALECAAARGVQVVVQAYSEVELSGVEVFITQNHDEVISFWQSQQLNIVADGKETLVALFDQSLQKVFHATWSTNVYLSCIVHAGRTCEQTIHRMLALPASEDRLQQMDRILNGQKFFRNSDVPGIKELFARHLRTKED